MMNLIAVDDEKDVKVLFEHFMQDEVSRGEINLIFVPSGLECLEELEKLNSENQTIVLSDINMPGMSGIELLKNINESYPSVKVILVSAYDQNHYYDEIKAHGAMGYIAKPVDFVALKEMVTALQDE